MKLTPIDQHPQYRAAAAEINDLNAALAKVSSRLQEISVLLSAPAAPAKDSVNVAAALEFAATGQVRSAPSLPDGLVEERRILEGQEGALVKAINSRRQTHAALVSALSGDLAKDLEARHKALATQYLDKLGELDAIAGQELQMLNEIERAGYDVRFRESLVWLLMGRLDDSSGSAMFYRARELRNYIN